MVELQDIFDIQYGHSLDLNKLIQSPDGINFVSRTAKNNGVSAKVINVDLEPLPKDTITVSLGGSVLEAFLQPLPYFTGYHIFSLKEKQYLTINQKLYYCLCIRANKYKYNYGRQANRTLRNLIVPSIEETPAWINDVDLSLFDGACEPVLMAENIPLNISAWAGFKYSELFTIERGRGPRIKDLTGKGLIPFITSIDSNNGMSAYTEMPPIHEGNVIGVNRNGSVAEAFYQSVPFCSTEDVHIFIPKFEFNQYIAMFLIPLIKLEKYRYNYGRKWGIARMQESVIRLPVTENGIPDWKFMEFYVKTLPFSKGI